MLSETAKKADWLIALALALATAVLYLPVRAFEFVVHDDPFYVTENPWVRGGFTVEALRAAFSSGDEGFWFPLTRFSHTLDFRLFGDWAGGHHLVSVAIHIAATLVLFLFLRRATAARWPAAFVAAAFALHPLHVESVAWVAERKDVLCALFWFLTLWLWVRYTERPSTSRYLAALATFGLGLMAKPMIITLPFLLLVLEYWPLRRRCTFLRLLEKVPFGILAIAASWAAFATQGTVSAVQSTRDYPMFLRVYNALVCWVQYLFDIFWPHNLAVIYPYPPSIPTLYVTAALGLLLAITGLAFHFRTRFPYLLVGWLWYLGTLVPVIGLIQVGGTARTDHFMYVPLVGPAIMLAWAGADFAVWVPKARQGLIALALTACLAMSLVTARQLTYWYNSEVLFRRALAVTADNYLALFDLSVLLEAKPGHLNEAIDNLSEAVRISPLWPKLRVRLASQMMQAKRYEEAVTQARTAISIAPGMSAAHMRLGTALAASGNAKEALPSMIAAMQLDPGSREARSNLGAVLMGLNRLDEAIIQLKAAVQLDPAYANAHLNLGAALMRVPGRRSEALQHFETALKLQPDPALRRQLDSLR